jgi:hypothetical protein
MPMCETGMRYEAYM